MSLPPITTSTMFTYLPWLILGYIVYIAYTYRNRIWVTFRRYDKSKAGKWANARNKDGTWGDVEFEGGLYHVEPARTVIGWRMLLGFVPFPVRESDYVQGSARALDPSNFDNSFSAEERKQLELGDDLTGLMNANREQAKAGQGKRGMLEQYLPYIMIAGFAIVAYFLFTMKHSQDMLGAGQNLIEAQLAKILASLP